VDTFPETDLGKIAMAAPARAYLGFFPMTAEPQPGE